MRAVLAGQVDPVQAGVFLIALRMKRETDDEYRGVLDAIREATRRATAPVDDVVDLARSLRRVRSHAAGLPFPAGAARRLRRGRDLPRRRAHGTQVRPHAPPGAARRRPAGGPRPASRRRAPRRPLHRLGLRRPEGVLPRPARPRRPALAHRQAPGHHHDGRAGRAGARPQEDPPGHRLRAQGLSAHLCAARAPCGLRLRAHRARRRGRRDPLLVPDRQGVPLPRATARSSRRNSGPRSWGSTTRCAPRPFPAPGAAGDEEESALDHAAVAIAAAQRGLAALGGEAGPTRDSLAYAAAHLPLASRKAAWRA